MSIKRQQSIEGRDPKGALSVCKQSINLLRQLQQGTRVEFDVGPIEVKQLTMPGYGPYTSKGIGCDAPHRVGGQAVTDVIGAETTVAVPCQTAIRADPKTSIAVFGESRDGVARNGVCFACAVYHEGGAVESGETAPGTDPKKAIARFVHGANRVLREATVGGPGT